LDEPRVQVLPETQSVSAVKPMQLHCPILKPTSAIRFQ
jgi:hypothetical protein